MYVKTCSFRLQAGINAKRQHSHGHYLLKYYLMAICMHINCKTNFDVWHQRQRNILYKQVIHVACFNMQELKAILGK